MSIFIKNNEYKIIKQFPEGGSKGKVYQVMSNSDNKYYVIKEFLIKGETKEAIDKFQNEADILSKFNSENIIKYYDSSKDNEKFYILMEFCEGQTLKSFIEENIKNNTLIEENILYNIIKQICLGIKEIHKKKIVHRDLKPENIFMNKKMIIKIGDFDISKQLKFYKTSTLTINKSGTINYIAPEIIYNGIYNEKADMWSLGCIIYELFTLNVYSKDKFWNDIKQLDPDIYDYKWQKLINSLLQNDYKKRFDINQVYEYIFKEDENKINMSNELNLNNGNYTNNIEIQHYELLLFPREKNNRIRQKLLWKYHKKLVSKDKLYYTDKEKELIKQLLYNEIPPEFRKEFWFISTGAKLECKNNPNYYQKLKKLIPNDINFPFIKDIELDIHNTFPNNNFFKKEENLIKLNNRLKAFSLRNCSSIAYCHGLNYIAAQLLLVFEEEEKTFWTFTKIIEDYLPLDFYLKNLGLKVDIVVMKSIILKKLNFIGENLEFDLFVNNLIFRCFLSLYSETINTDTLCNIWDIFFIYGDIILFRTFQAIAFLLFDKKYIRYNIETVQEELTKKLYQIKSNDFFKYFLLVDRNISGSLIQGVRKIKKNSVYKKFYTLFKEKTVDKNIICDLKSPFCYSNKPISEINKFSEFKIFKLKQNTKRYNNYFFDKLNYNNKGNNIIKKELYNDNYDDILIERMNHDCKI